MLGDVIVDVVFREVFPFNKELGVKTVFDHWYAPLRRSPAGGVPPDPAMSYFLIIVHHFGVRFNQRTAFFHDCPGSDGRGQDSRVGVNQQGPDENMDKMNDLHGNAREKTGGYESIFEEFS